jgi:hypothetical protein
MRNIITASLVVLGLQSRAIAQEPTVNTTSPHNVLVNFGWTNSGMGIGVDYERAYHRTFGLGGYFRIYNDDANENSGLMTVGAFIRPHFTRQAWDFYVSPGFGLVQQDLNANNDETYFGPSLAIGLIYQWNYEMAFGVENMQIYGWFGDDAVKGMQSNELLAKFRYSF